MASFSTVSPSAASTFTTTSPVSSTGSFFETALTNDEIAFLKNAPIIEEPVWVSASIVLPNLIRDRDWSVDELNSISEIIEECAATNARLRENTAMLKKVLPNQADFEFCWRNNVVEANLAISKMIAALKIPGLDWKRELQRVQTPVIQYMKASQLRKHVGILLRTDAVLTEFQKQV